MKHVLLGAAIVAGMVVPAAAQQISLGRFFGACGVRRHGLLYFTAKRGGRLIQFNLDAYQQNRAANLDLGDFAIDDVVLKRSTGSPISRRPQINCFGQIICKGTFGLRDARFLGIVRPMVARRGR